MTARQKKKEVEKRKEKKKKKKKEEEGEGEGRRRRGEEEDITVFCDFEVVIVCDKANYQDHNRQCITKRYQRK